MVSARRADGSVDVDELVVERTVVAYPDGGSSRLHIDTIEWERKLDDLLEIDPLPALVTLCGARVTTSHPRALAGVRAELRRFEVGHDPSAGSAELTALLVGARALPIEDAATPVVCGDAGDVSTHLDGYAFRHRAVLEIDQDDLLRLSWDGAIELSLDVLLD
jgi:hypothetical protein